MGAKKKKKDKWIKARPPFNLYKSKHGLPFFVPLKAGREAFDLFFQRDIGPESWVAGKGREGASNLKVTDCVFEKKKKTKVIEL